MQSEFVFAVLSLELMKMLKEQGLPTRPHYFWPLLTQHLKAKNTDGMSLPLFLPKYFKNVRKPATSFSVVIIVLV